MPFHRQAEAPRRGEIERAGRPGNFPDHEGQITAAQSFLQREQGIFGRGGGDMD